MEDKMREVPSKNTRCRLGVARRDVTAPVGIYSRYWGAADNDVAEGVHKSSSVTAAVISPANDADAPRLALISLDYCAFMPQADERALRGKILERTGFDESALLLNLSHCHTGANASSKRVDLPGGDRIPAYLKLLEDQTVDAIQEAEQTASPAWITWGSGTCSLATNRDYWDAESEEWGTGFNPLGEQDQTVLVGRVSSDDGSIRAILFNYACHPTTLAWDNNLLSPDYIGAAREVIERAFDAPAMFFQGASGELGPRNGFVGDTEVADRNGRQLGYAVAEAVEGLPPAATSFTFTGIVKSGAAVAAWEHRPMADDELSSARHLQVEQSTVDLPVKNIPSADEIRGRLEGDLDRADEERLNRLLAIREDIGESDVYSMSLWVWRLGDAAIVAIPNEPYSLFQTALREKFPDHPMMVLGVTNGTLGYLCPAEFYGSGRYQDWQSPFKAGCLEQSIAGASALLSRCY